ncbi:hypothetical protein [Paramicrobacterium fandaimingii]|uniref:hypothetical protein n=1 Tax=Paramicrobacterium fandaimingii TaxID=2708079 RepID=UPI00141DC34D|nr:hypothetical protein [Microbacterium fandaimingii]
MTRTMKRAGVLTALAAGLLIGGVLAVVQPVSSQAAEGDDERGYPEIVPAWYLTAASAPYEGASPSNGMDESLSDTGLSVAYFMPDGGAPSSGQGDISVTYMAPSGVASSTITFTLNTLPDLTAEMGSDNEPVHFTDGILLPTNDNRSATFPDVRISAGTVVLTRAATPEDCDADDPSSFEFQLAMLADNEYKYLVDVDVDFGARPEIEQTTRETKCAAEQAEQEAAQAPPSDTSDDEDVQNGYLDPDEANGVVTCDENGYCTDEEGLLVERPEANQAPFGARGWQAIVGSIVAWAAGIAAAVAICWFLFHKFRTITFGAGRAASSAETPEYDDDGNPLSSTKATRRTGRSSFVRWVVGKPRDDHENGV